MRLAIVALACVVVVVSGANSAKADIIAGPFTNPSNGSNYYVTEKTNWTDAQNQAVVLGGNLVTINNESENQWLASTFANIPGLTWPGNAGAGKVFYTGFNDIQVEGQWVWVSGEPVTYTNWTSSEPSDLPFPGGGEDAGQIYVDSGSFDGSTWIAGQWNSGPGALVSQPGYDPVYAIIEVAAVPEPSSLLLVPFALCLLNRRNRRAD